MCADAAGIVRGESLERLTLSIRKSFAAIEKRWPGQLDYGDVPLRGALERRVYQEALLDPGRLETLVDVTGDRADFAEWLPQDRSRPDVSTIWGYLKAWARLITYGLLRASRQGHEHDRAPATEFVFCAIRPRFVNFFRPVIEQHGKHRCALVCDPGYGVEQEAARHGLVVCKRQYARLQVRSVRRPPRALFPFYTIAIVEFLRALGTLRCYRPRVVVFAEAASFPEEVMARAARAFGIATVRVQYGRAGVISPGYYEMPYDKMLMWGEGFVDRLRHASPDCRYIVTGSPLMDKMKQSGISTFPRLFAADKPVISVISQPECVSISRQDYEALVAIVDRVLTLNVDLNVLVRLHPADKASDFDQLAKRWPGRVRVTGVQELALENVIGESVLVAGLYSTVLSEAAASGVLPVVIRLGERHAIFPSPEEQGAAALATTPDEAVETICRLAADTDARSRYKDGMNAFARRYFGPMDGGAVVRIAAHIENAVSLKPV
jgi:hypothetical protein